MLSKSRSHKPIPHTTNKFYLRLPPAIHVTVDNFTQNGQTVNFELVHACFLSNFHAQTACEIGINFRQSYSSTRKISRKLIPSSVNKFRANLTRCFRSKFHIGLHCGFGVHFRRIPRDIFTCDIPLQRVSCK